MHRSRNRRAHCESDRPGRDTTKALKCHGFAAVGISPNADRLFKFKTTPSSPPNPAAWGWGSRSARSIHSSPLWPCLGHGKPAPRRHVFSSRAGERSTAFVRFASASPFKTGGGAPGKPRGYRCRAVRRAFRRGDRSYRRRNAFEQFGRLEKM